MARLPFAVAPLDLGTVVSGNEASGGSASFLNLPYMGMVWRSNGDDSLFIRGDMLVEQEIDFIALLSANATADTKIRIRLGSTQAEVDGTADYDSGETDFIDPVIVRKDGLYHSHHEIETVQTARWWRIDIIGHTGDFEASRLIMGKKITPVRFYDRDFERGVEDLGNLEISRNGVLHVARGQKLRKLKFTLAWMTEVEFEDSFRPLMESLGNTGLCYWCFDPEPSSYRHGRTYYGWFGQQPYATGGAKPKTFQQDFQITSLI